MADETEILEDEKVEQADKQAPVVATPQDNVANLLRDRDRREKEMRQKHEKDLKKLQEELASQKKANDELAKPQSARADGETVETLQVRMSLMDQRFQQKEAELQAQIAKERVAREAAEEAQRQSEKTRLLREALSQVGVTDPEVAYRYFRDSITWDEIDGRWAYRMLDGRTVAVREGIDAEIPNALKASSLRGGTGATGSAPTTKGKVAKELETISAEMSNVEREIKLRGANQNLLAKFMELQRRKSAAENELSKAK